MSLSLMFRIIGSPRESDVRNEEGNLADDRDLIADAMNDGGRASDRYVNNDSRKNIVYGLVIGVRGAEKRIRSPIVYRKAEVDHGLVWREVMPL
jgi:hypothetical protein